MTPLVILTSAERKKFDAPPKFNTEERSLHFSLSHSDIIIVNDLRSASTKVGFVLQLGYFKSHAKFYSADQFRQSDITYVAKMLGLNANQIDLSKYHKKVLINHQSKILTLVGWHNFDNIQLDKIKAHALWLVQRQLSLKQLFLSIVDFLWSNKIELPSYNTIGSVISNAYEGFESGLIDILSNKLTREHFEKLDSLINAAHTSDKKSIHKTQISLLKKLSHSLDTSEIKATVESFVEIKSYFFEFSAIISELNLSDQATEYFATWFQKSTTLQIRSIANKFKLFLYLLCYIKHQYYTRNDFLVDILLKSVQGSINSAHKQLHQKEKESRNERNKAIKGMSSFSKDARLLIDQITETVNSPILSEQAKLSKVQELIAKYHSEHQPSEVEDIKSLEQSLDKITKEQTYFEFLETASIKLQGKVSLILKHIEFNPDTSSTPLIEAINHFKKTDGDIGKSPPDKFMDENQRHYIENSEKHRTSLYKIFQFIHVANAVKSGNINLKHTYRYKAIDEYLLDKDDWKINRNIFIDNAKLVDFADFNKTINTLKNQLDERYSTVNENILNNKNTFLTFDKKGKLKLKTPKIDSDETEYVPSLLSQAGFVPVIQILSDINKITEFTDSFTHITMKYKKMNPSPEVIYAGIMGKGCNLGLNKIANISQGISEDPLKNVVNWCFSLKNIQSASNKIMAMINKLFLPSLYRHSSNELHTSSDGKKINVARDSLNASYSFKYFGKEKGVSVYTFLDERQLLFHSTVISASEREAAYVIDGLMHNEVVKSDIHSTDTHGFTETIFAATHFINTAFAPRIKHIAKQKLYGFSGGKTYEKRGYKILPSRTINLKLIERHWDDILRFMATIKLKHCSASLLFKRLSSYAKNHSLYQAIKEFGRIIKSMFILTYFDKTELRQRIQKQLNKVEMSNRFSDAIFFADNREFKYSSKEDQDIATACKVLIQNAIVLWNYLYVSNLLANNADPDERSRMAFAVSRGSMMCWGHVNMQGEYDFREIATANESPFDMEKILALKIA